MMASKEKLNKRFGSAKSKSWRNAREIPAEYRKKRRQENREVTNFSRSIPLEEMRKFKHVKNDYNAELPHMFSNPLSFAIFKDHCDKEFSAENYMFLEMTATTPIVVDHANEFTKDLTVGEAIYLHETFIKVGAMFEINISSKLRLKFKNAISSLMNETTSPEQSSQPISEEIKTLFSQGRHTMFGLLRDSFTRFKRSRKYRYAYKALVDSGEFEPGQNFINDYENARQRSIGANRSWMDFLGFGGLNRMNRGSRRKQRMIKSVMNRPTRM